MLLLALVGAAAYRTDKSMQRKITIKRKGKVAFSFTVRPISEGEAQDIRKVATVYMANPQGPKYPQIAKEIDNVRYNNAVIYTATIDEDKERIWGNPEVMARLGVLEPADTIDRVLMTGEKSDIVTEILSLSGTSGDSISTEDMAKN